MALQLVRPLQILQTLGKAGVSFFFEKNIVCMASNRQLMVIWMKPFV